MSSTTEETNMTSTAPTTAAALVKTAAAATAAPSTVAAATTSVVKDWTWVVQHLTLLFSIGLLIFGGIYGVECLIARHDRTAEERYSKILADQVEQTKQTEAKWSQDEQNWQQLATQLAAQNAEQQKADAARDAQTSQLIQKISAMQAPQVVADLQPKLRHGIAITEPDGTVKLDLPASRDVDEQITEGTAAKADLASAQTQLANETTLYNNSQKDVADAKVSVVAEQKKTADQVVACNTEVKSIKAEARKSKAKLFVAGYVMGFLTRVLTVK
jgi:Tfp pilus assembly protein FimV